MQAYRYTDFEVVQDNGGSHVIRQTHTGTYPPCAGRVVFAETIPV
jgi:hypothetical protein